MMRRIILLIFLMILFCNCSLPEQTLPGVPEFATIQEAKDWIKNEIKYKYRIVNLFGCHWQPADETCRKKTGCCIDFSILFAEILHQQFGKNCICKIGFNANLNVGHAWVEYSRGKYNYIKGFDYCVVSYSYDQLQYEIANRQYL